MSDQASDVDESGRRIPVPGWAAVSGGVAALVALGVGELVTAVDGTGASLVSTIGDEFIDRFAASLKELAVSLFGTNDKVALVVGIVVVSTALGAAFGVASRRRRWVGPAGFASFGALGAAAYSQAPLVSTGVGVVAGVVAAVGGSVALLWLLGRSPAASSDAAPGPTPNDGVATDGGELVAAPRSAMGVGGPGSRRSFLASAAILTAGAAGTAALGRRLSTADPGADLRATTTLPRPVASTSVPGGQPFTVPGLSPYVTPTPDFYRIDTALVVPRVDPESWRLNVGGLVDRPFSLDFDDLLAMDSVEEVVTLQCVSNEIGGDLVDNAVWQGVPLAVLLERAGVQQAGTQVLSRSVDGWTAGFPTEVGLDGRVALVAYGMNGELLPPRHGFPARLVVSGLYGYVSATKWLTDIELTRIEEVDGYWIPRGWSKDGPIKLMSRIDVPGSGADLTAGTNAVAGVAWSPTVGVAAVEVSVDEGPWLPCELGRVASEHTWVQWHLAWDAAPGSHVLRVRATDRDGNVQTDAVTPPQPDGATGHHARRVQVS